MYAFLLTQEDLTYCGTIPLRESGWARIAGMPVADVRRELGVLSGMRWVVIDRDTDELMVRSLTRRDKVLRQPKLWIPFSRSVGQIESAEIRAVLLAELVRCRADGEVNLGLRRDLDALIRDLEMSLDSLSGSQSGRRSLSLAGSHADTPQGEGERNGSNQRCPLPLTPFPLPPDAAGEHVTIPSPCDGVTEEEEVSPGNDDDQAPSGAQVDALVTEVRKLRKDWSTRSIRRSLADHAVAERPWALVCQAFIAVAKDPESKSPGRLSHDGPWWHRTSVAAAAPAPRPPWCGECNEANRLTEDPETRDPARCPKCHPKSASTT